jgi:hypothetical protein
VSVVDEKHVTIRRIVLDVMKPYKPDIVSLSLALSRLSGVEGVNIGVYEFDKDVENVKLTVEGTDINFEQLKRTIEKEGAIIHSVDEVVSGKKIIEEVETLQDRH